MLARRLDFACLFIRPYFIQHACAFVAEDKFSQWAAGAEFIVQDFERCLRSPGPLRAFEQLQLELVPGYPRVSQDFNAIENCWKVLRERLDETRPRGVEDRDAFVVRLKKAVVWMNRNRRKQLVMYATNQKTRCRDCLNTKPRGGRTAW